MVSSQGCLHSPNSFCYICGFYIGVKQVKHGIKVTMKFAQAYELYFGIKIGDQNKSVNLIKIYEMLG